MVRSILGIVAGIFAGVLVIALVESLGHGIFPPPEGVDLKDPDALQSVMGQIPIGAKLAVLVAWGLGAFVGALVALRIGVGNAIAAWIVGAILFAFAVSTMMVIPHPLWMMIGAVIVYLAGVIAANHVAHLVNPSLPD